MFDIFSSKKEEETSVPSSELNNISNNSSNHSFIDKNTQEEYIEYNLTLYLYYDTVKELNIKVYLSNSEVYTLQQYLNKKIDILCKTNSSVALSFVYRNENGKIITQSFTNVYAISHDLPPLQFVDDGE